MASCQLQPQLEERSPQPSISGYPLLEVTDDELPGPSVPWVDPGTPSEFLYWNMKSEWSDESEEEPEEETDKKPEETWVLDPLSGLKTELKQEPVSPMPPEDYKAFNRLPDSSPPNFLPWQKKRDWSDESEEELEEETGKEYTPEPEETWVLDTLCGLKMKLKRQRVSPVLPKRYEAFNTLLGPSSPWILCRKRKREWSEESEEDPEEESGKECTPEPEETWVLERLQGLKMKIKRRRVSTVLPEHHQAFNRLLEDPVVKKFLAWDTYLLASDKYLLAMVIAYFSRAGLFSWQYERIHFFLALYLANDMEEDNQGPKQAIFYFLYGKDRSQQRLFQKLRFQFFCSMRCRAWVSPEELEEIHAYDPEHWVWARDRANFL
ncbi:putative speedy protein-like protein 3 [Callithrix jacchus]|uniref:putative speedy protein-like protein 3 n=1 Tax=Callithrix jacchus TaxID=9483 RepID=UPI00159D2AD9|nr:putative speedy protein-like protein 3 [Callithrix jacchus]XP_054104955.1 putative speedy protein-like protein 3 [Callithrix jacchus]